ncbi:hypothetical protein THF1C08_320032 [Vibrio jasicida]|uniref:Uncharacterized protein n=1 Tax=Vibrio jasicida TaxID=766224 RepID=A0AAU9QSN7_9VIBR|nr:hypothetical protein THF1C08_320032 [Vibrio jasicida]CAH1597376.1 hypothetical protein THF1A12_320032 [Vibrio jasicida]
MLSVTCGASLNINEYSEITKVAKHPTLIQMHNREIEPKNRFISPAVGALPSSNLIRFTTGKE